MITTFSDSSCHYILLEKIQNLTFVFVLVVLVVVVRRRVRVNIDSLLFCFLKFSVDTIIYSFTACQMCYSYDSFVKLYLIYSFICVNNEKNYKNI